jgi:hypothetical protein
MYSLSPPGREGLVDFDSIVARRGANAKVILEKVHADIAKAYCDYIEVLGNGALIGPLSLGEVAAQELRANFRLLDRRRSHGYIRDEILSIAQWDLCPYCSVTMVDSLDHVLPTSICPEFAVLAQNLVPACTRCNRMKDDACFKKSGKNLAHPYFVKIPYNPILFASVVVGKNAVTWTFYLQSHGDIDDATFECIKNLFTILNLADLYIQYSTVEIMERWENLDTMYKTGGTAALQGYLEREANSVQKIQGENYWKTVILRSLAQSNPFCNGGYQHLRKIDTP